MSKSRPEKTKYYRPTELTFYQPKKIPINEAIANAMRNFTEENGYTPEMRDLIEAVLPFIHKLNNKDQKISGTRRKFFLTNINCRVEQLRNLGCTVEEQDDNYNIIAPGQLERVSLAIQEIEREEQALRQVSNGINLMLESLNSIENFLRQFSNYQNVLTSTENVKKTCEEDSNPSFVQN